MPCQELIESQISYIKLLKGFFFFLIESPFIIRGWLNPSNFKIFLIIKKLFYHVIHGEKNICKENKNKG